MFNVGDFALLALGEASSHRQPKSSIDGLKSIITGTHLASAIYLNDDLGRQIYIQVKWEMIAVLSSSMNKELSQSFHFD